MHALTFSRFGGPEVLEWREVPDPAPAPGHVIVRTHAIGLNYADVYRRRGNYHLQGEPPWIAGYEAAGVVEHVADDVLADADGRVPRVGDRVAFADAPFANAELVRVPADRLIPLPDDVPFQTAAALLLQGLTAHYLSHDSHPARPGEDAVVHAAAGGVGLLLIQVLRRLGARVLGLTSSAAKADAARQAGADAVALYGDGDWVGAARTFSRDGRGVDVVYDSVGSTLGASLDAARTGGRVVFFGMAGGDPDPVDPRRLMDESKSVTGGDLWNVLTSRDERIRRANALFGWVRDGSLVVRVEHTFPLRDGAAAHALLESRATIGKILLLP
jgi:NADPH2:quinone reductase